MLVVKKTCSARKELNWKFLVFEFSDSLPLERRPVCG